MIEDLKKLFEKYTNARDDFNVLIDEINGNQSSAGIVKDELTEEQREQHQNAEGNMNKASSLVLGHPPFIQSYQMLDG